MSEIKLSEDTLYSVKSEQETYDDVDETACELLDTFKIDEFVKGITVLPGISKKHTSPLKPAISRILNSYKLNDDIMSEFLRLGLTAEQLGTLNDLDLQMLGVTNEPIRSQMLNEFSGLDGNNPKSNRTENPISSSTECNKLILTNVFTHLSNLNCAINDMLTTLYVQPMDNIQINERTYSSSAVIRTLHNLTHTVSLLEERLLNLQFNHTSPNSLVCCSQPKRVFWFAVIGSISSVVGALAIRNWRQLRQISNQAIAYTLQWIV